MGTKYQTFRHPIYKLLPSLKIQISMYEEKNLYMLILETNDHFISIIFQRKYTIATTNRKMSRTTAFSLPTLLAFFVLYCVAEGGLCIIDVSQSSRPSRQISTVTV